MKLVSKILSAMLLLVISASLVLAQGSGAIWTTKADCGDVTQDANQYDIGEVVYINGDNFASDLYDWDITGQPGGASCDPNTVVASGQHFVNASGAFCFEAYTVLPGDCGTYKATFGNKQDNYRVDDSSTDIPEFTTIGAGLVLAGAGAYMYRKRK